MRSYTLIALSLVTLVHLSVNSVTWAQCAASSDLPQIASNLIEGAKEVSGSIGHITASGGHTCTVTVELWLRLVATASATPGDTELQQTVDADGNQVRTLLGSATASGDQFNIKLSDPLLAGQQVFLIEHVTDTSGDTTTNLAPKFSAGVMRVSAFASWGLVRAYFTSGFLLSQDQGSFSQSNLFLSFTIDKTWRLPNSHLYNNGRFPGINSFFETRLTSIPVNSCAQQSGTSESGGSSTSTDCVNNAGGGGGSSTPLDTFLANQKTARLAIGVYLPATVTNWTYKGTPNALFVAPIAKIGFDTPAGSLSQTQPSNSTGTGTSGATSVVAVNPTNFYKFYTFGARFGHFAMTTSKSQAPETLSYLDFTFGRFSNLESLVNTAALANSRERLWRINVEGILKVPSTPLIVGFSANVGMKNPGAPPIIQGAGDDLRFLFGAKFDMAKLMAKIGQIAP